MSQGVLWVTFAKSNKMLAAEEKDYELSTYALRQVSKALLCTSSLLRLWKYCLMVHFNLL